MAQPTQNANAIAFQQDILAAAAQAKSLLLFCQSIQARQATHNYAANLQAMPTYTPDASGNPPTTTANGVTSVATDAAPDQGHPIVGLNVSFYSIDIFRSVVIGDLVTMLTGGGAVAASDHRPLIDALLA